MYCLPGCPLISLFLHSYLLIHCFPALDLFITHPASNVRIRWLARMSQLMPQYKSGTGIPSSFMPNCLICMQPEFEWLAVDLCATQERQQRKEEREKWSTTDIAIVLTYRLRHRSQVADLEQKHEEFQKAYSRHIKSHIWHIWDSMRTMTTIYGLDKDFDERFFSDLGKASEADLVAERSVRALVEYKVPLDLND